MYGKDLKILTGQVSLPAAIRLIIRASLLLTISLPALADSCEDEHSNCMEPIVINYCDSNPGDPQCWPSPYEMPPELEYPNEGGGGAELALINALAGDGNGDGIPDEPPLPCNLLSVTKPANCPEPIQFPIDPYYRHDEIKSGSALARARYFAEFNPTVHPYVKQRVKESLTAHTYFLAEGRWPASEMHGALISDVAIACNGQRHADEANRRWLGVAATQAEKNCWEIVEMLGAEAGEPRFLPWFHGWLQSQGLSPSDLGIPQTIVDVFSPQNSITKKTQMVSEDAKCARWWSQMKRSSCPA